MKKKIMNEQQRLNKIINRLVKESITDLSNMYNEESEDNDYNSNESSDDETEKERKVRISVEKELKKPGINIAPYAYKLEGLSISDSSDKEGDDNEHKNARSKLYKKLNHKPDSNGNPQYLSPEEALHLKNELSNTLSESKKMDVTMSDLCYMVNESVKKVLQMTKSINESYAKDGNYTHFAVNKETNKIVNGWDYSDIESDILKTYKRDYFIEDLIDYDLNPKDHKILTIKGCQKQGINPYDDTQWANQ